QGVGCEIDADAEHQPIDQPPAVHLRFEKDAGELAPGEQDIIGPFEADRRVWRDLEAGLAQGERRGEAELRGPCRGDPRPEDDRDVEVSGRRHPRPALAPMSLGLLQSPDQRALGRARCGEHFRLVIGAAEAPMAQQAVEIRKQRLALLPNRARRSGVAFARRSIAHPVKRAAATASAPSAKTPGQAKKNRVTSAQTMSTAPISRPIGRSNAATGSSKYISLTMRM